MTAIKAKRIWHFDRPTGKHSIMSFNQVRRYSSSPSTDEDDGASGSYARGADDTEEHSSKKCKYIRYEPVVSGHKVYINIRVCKCGQYQDISTTTGLKLDFNVHDGKDVHTSAQCGWTKRKVKRWGRKVYRLTKYCQCDAIPQQRSSQTRAMNYPTHY